MRTLAFAGIICFGAPVLADDYAALFDEAAGAVEWDIEKAWAFTETRSMDDERWVARYDPRRPDGEEWTLLSIDGRPPTAAESREFRDEKADVDTADSSNRVRIVGRETLELVEETDTRWTFRFTPDEDEAEFTESVDATASIRKDGPWLERIDLENHSDIEPGFGTRISTFVIRMEFGPAVVDGPVVPKRMNIQVSGRALLFIGFSETELIEYSDFEYVGDKM